MEADAELRVPKFGGVDGTEVTGEHHEVVGGSACQGRAVHSADRRHTDALLAGQCLTRRLE